MAWAEGWEGHSCLSVLSCGTRAAFPEGLFIVAKHPFPNPEVEDGPAGEAPDWVAFILASKLTITSYMTLDKLFKFVISVSLSFFIEAKRLIALSKMRIE